MSKQPFYAFIAALGVALLIISLASKPPTPGVGEYIEEPKQEAAKYNDATSSDYPKAPRLSATGIPSSDAAQGAPRGNQGKSDQETPHDRWLASEGVTAILPASLSWLGLGNSGCFGGNCISFA